MLALVKKPHIEISLHGERVDELLAWISKKYDVSVLTDDPADEFVPIESTEYWQKMEKNRIGNLLVGARLKAGLTQVQLAKKLGICQNSKAKGTLLLYCFKNRCMATDPRGQAQT